LRYIETIENIISKNAALCIGEELDCPARCNEEEEFALVWQSCELQLKRAQPIEKKDNYATG
jgi:hypothetical protein